MFTLDVPAFIIVLKRVLADPEVRDLLRAALVTQSGQPGPRLYATSEQYAEHRGVSLSTVKRWIKLGLPSSMNVGVRRINVEQSDEWLDSGGTNIHRR